VTDQPTLIQQLAEWASELDLGDVPERVVELAKSQVLSQLAAARAGMSHPIGAALVRAFGPPLQPDAKQSACVLAGLTAWLQMDDTAYAGHLSNSTVNVPLAYACANGDPGAERRSGRDVLTAVIAANECAARLTAAATLGPFRGQSATHTHLAGAVSARLRLAGAPSRQWVNALALAFGMPPRVLAPAFIGSDTKVLNAFTPVRMGLDACDAAAAGLTGAAEILEHPQGFLSRFSSVPLPEVVTAGLGKRWHTDTLSFKLHPGGPGVDAAVDCAAEVVRQLGPLDVEDIEEATVHTSWYTVFTERSVARLANPHAPVSVLVLSTPYTVATTLLTGALTPADFAPPLLHEPRRWALAERVRVVHDPELTRDSFRCLVPFGEALRIAGPRAVDWEFGAQGEDLATLGLGDLLGDAAAPSESFEDATKATGARLTVRLATGRTVTQQRDIPLGGAGPHTRAHHADLVRNKFLGTGGDEAIADAVAVLDKLSADELSDLVRTALRM
jgi:2-methylcitrate dehydratase PrpD